MIKIIVAAYKIPPERRQMFFDENDAVFKQNDCKCYIVTDNDIDAPEWCKVCVYPVELKQFNLSAVCNYGIRQAGSGMIIKTDIDCIFTTEMFTHDLIVVDPGDFIFWWYWMIKKPERKHHATVWPQGRGTVGMWFDDWCKICGYNENMTGYGIEDGDVCRRAVTAGLFQFRGDAKLYHVQHGRNGARSFWNRENNFNPANHEFNQTQDGNWNNPEWGKPAFLSAGGAG